MTHQESEYLRGKCCGEEGRGSNRKVCVSPLETGMEILKHMGLGLLQPNLLLPIPLDNGQDAEFTVLHWDRGVFTELVSLN